MSDAQSISSHLKESRRFEPPKEFAARARIGSRADYDRLYRESIESPETFWKRETSSLVWRKPWTKLLTWELPHSKWFEGATLNVTESCLDQHLSTETRKKIAILWEGEVDEGQPSSIRKITYEELHREVVRCAGALAKLGVNKGDRVAIYMGMVPEVAVAMLACARLGATHSVVFGGFAADALRDRINDAEAKVLITQDEGWRAGKVVPLKRNADEAVAGAPTIEKVVVLRRTGTGVPWSDGRDVWWHELVYDLPADCPPEPMDAEDLLYLLYTSGTTARPKGIMHTTGGYLAGVSATH